MCAKRAHFSHDSRIEYTVSRAPLKPPVSQAVRSMSETREGGRGMVYRSRQVSDFTKLLNESRQVSNCIIQYPSINPQWSVLFNSFNERANLVDILSEGF